MSDKYVAISNIAGYYAGYYDTILYACPLQTAGLLKPNARFQPRLEAGAERTLEGVGCKPLFGDAFTLHVLSLVCRRMGYGDDLLSPTRFLYLTISPQLLQQRLGLLEVGGVKALGEPAVDWGQQLASLRALALLLPQAAQTHGGA